MTTTRRQFLAHAGAALVLPLVGRSQPEPMVKFNPPVPMEPVGKTVDIDALLWAIAEVETGQRDDVVGPCGSRSKLQISYAVWRQHTPLTSYDEFVRRCNKRQAEWCAIKHLRWLELNLPRHTMTEVYQREYALGWAWHKGLTSWERYSSGASFSWTEASFAHDYAYRVSNLYALRVKGQA